MDAPAAMAATDVVWLFYTSGTTGRPKGVMITARNAATMALAYAVDVDRMHHRDAALYAAPMSHGAGLYCLPHVIAGEEVMVERLASNGAILSRMAKIGSPVEADTVPAGSAQIVVDGVTIAFPLEGAIDLNAEKARLSKAAEAAEKERDSLAARLANPAFAERARPEAVDKARADHAAKAAEAERLRAALDRLG